MTNLHQTSIEIIRKGQAATGAYVASPTFSQYGYSWLRDGAWIAHAMDGVGQRDSAEAFHRWVVRAVIPYQPSVTALIAKIQRGEQPLESEYLPTRFRLDGRPGEEEWGNFQLDGYGAWLWSLTAHCQTRESDLWQTARPAIQLVVDYLSTLWQSPNYDCWEEHRHRVHTATLAALYGGLKAVHTLDPSLVQYALPERIRQFVIENCVTSQGHLMKFIGNEAVDASLLWAAVPFGLVQVNEPYFQATIAKIEADIRYPDGGVYRYAADTYYGGGEWPLLAAWLGWVYLETHQTNKTRQILRWIEAQATPSGELPEQSSEHMLDASYFDTWVKRWGTAACPLLWSHAMYLILESRLKGVVL
jgi:GH15 family glucan-1,4-alpha-glucosidase